MNDPYLVACLDIGHAEMFSHYGASAEEMIRALGSRIGALHVHDNDKWHDTHAVPGTMDIDFDAVIRALVDIGYDGDMTLEADGFVPSRNGADIPECLRIMNAAAVRLKSAFEGN